MLLLLNPAYSSREPDAAVSEGVNAIIHAAPRTELKGAFEAKSTVLSFNIGHIELHVLRDLLMHKYGRDYSAAVMENKDGVVSKRVRPRTVFILPHHALPRSLKRHRAFNFEFPSNYTALHDG